MTAWNGMAISAYALASRALTQEQPSATRCFPVEGRPPQEYLQAALKVSAHIKPCPLCLCCSARGCQHCKHTAGLPQLLASLDHR